MAMCTVRTDRIYTITNAHPVKVVNPDFRSLKINSINSAHLSIHRRVLKCPAMHSFSLQLTRFDMFQS